MRLRLLKRLVLGVLVAAIVVVCGFVTPAVAIDEVSNQVVAGGEHVVTIPMWIWTLGVGSVLPLLVGLLTKLNAPPGVKIIINLVLSAVSGLIGSAVVIGGAAVLSTSTLALAGLSLLQSIATYFGIWRPLNAQRNLGPNIGFG